MALPIHRDLHYYPDIPIQYSKKLVIEQRKFIRDRYLINNSNKQS